MVFALFGSYTDKCCLQVAKLLGEYNRRTLFIDEHSIDQLKFNWDFSEATGYLVLEEQRVEFEKVEGVLLRWNRNKVGVNEDELYKNHEWKGALLAWSHRISCPVINKPTPEYWYGDGPTYFELQHQFCQAGFKPLSTLVTQNLSNAENFLNKHSRRVFIQPMSSRESIYSLKNKYFESLLTNIIGIAPLMLVEYPDGERLEAFVFQDDIFLANKNGISVILDPSLIQILKHLSRTINVTFFQVHIVKCSSDSYFCIGFNDMPNYEWCSNDLKDKINHQLIRALGIR